MPLATPLALGAGVLSALLYVSTLAGSLSAIVLVLLAQLPLFLAGLSRGQGTRGAMIAGGTGLILVGLVAGLWAAGNYALAEAGPACLMVRQALLSRAHAKDGAEWYPPGRMVALLSLYAAVAFLAFVVAFVNADGGLKGELQRLFGSMREAFGLEQPPPAAAHMLDMLVSLMPGFGGGSWILITAANGWLAQGLLTRAGHNARPGPTLAEYVLPNWLAAAVTASAAVALLLPEALGFVAQNLCVILAIPFVFEGAALLQALVRRGGAKPGAMTALFIALGLFVLIMSWLALFVLAGLGFVDHLAGLRERLARPKVGPTVN